MILFILASPLYFWSLSFLSCLPFSISEKVNGSTIQNLNRRTDIWTHREEDEMNWEIRIGTHTLPCEKQIASGKLLCSTGSSARCWWPGGVRWGCWEAFKREGIYVSSWFTLLYSRKWLNIVKHLYSNKEKAMAPHSSTLAWKIPWTEEPGRL